MTNEIPPMLYLSLVTLRGSMLSFACDPDVTLVDELRAHVCRQLGWAPQHAHTLVLIASGARVLHDGTFLDCYSLEPTERIVVHVLRTTAGA